MTPDEHFTRGDDCPCVPLVIPIERGDGSIGWSIVHKVKEELSFAEQAERAAAIFIANDEIRQQGMGE